MNEDYTLLIVMQHYPIYQQLQVLSRKDTMMDTEVADFLRTTEQEVSKDVLDNVYSYASAAVHH